MLTFNTLIGFEKFYPKIKRNVEKGKHSILVLVSVSISKPHNQARH